MKIVINTKFGGFKLSVAAYRRIAALLGTECYFFLTVPNFVRIPEDQLSNRLFWTAFNVPNPEAYDLSKRDEDGTFTTANKKYREIQVPDFKDDRTNPILVQVVEELGEAANTPFSHLTIVDVPDDVEWTIEEYDGNEWVAEKHRTWS